MTLDRAAVKLIIHVHISIIFVSLIITLKWSLL